MGIAWIFAGQGAEEPGMGIALAAASTDARAWLDDASRVTGVDVPRALERGARVLERTEVLQPVLLAVGLASANSRDQLPDFVAGHSLGELTAACWAASLPRMMALELAATRGRAMAEAAASHPGGMVVVRCDPGDDLEPTLARGRAYGELRVAALNTDAETVVSGDLGAIAWLRAELPARCTPLRVAGAWHSERMRPAVAPFRAKLLEVFRDCSLRVPLVSACRVGEVSVEDLPDALADGIVRPVRFLDAVRLMEAKGIDHALLPEPHRVTRSLLRRACAAPWKIEI